MVPAAALTQSKPVSITTVRPVSAAVPKIKVNQPRHVNLIVTKSNSPIRRHITRSASPNTSNSPLRVTVVNALMVSVAQGMQGKWEWRPKCPILDHVYQTTSASMTIKRFDYKDALGRSKHMTGNMSYLSDFKELNGGYVAFGVNPKGGKISGKGKIKTDNYSRFTWVFFLATKDKTSPILKTFITGLENQLSLNVKVIRSDNVTGFKNNDLNQFYKIKGIKREFSVPRTPQQNGIAERKNRTLIEAARIMVADSLLPIPFWAEAVNTVCYVQNRVLVTKPHNKTPYELLDGRTPSISFMRPFGCLVTILNTLDSLGKFEGKVDEGFQVGYSVNSSGPTWLLDIDNLTRTMNYQPVTAGNQTNPSNNDRDASFDGKEHDFDAKKPESKVSVSLSSSAQSRKQDDKTKKEAKGKSHDITYFDDEDDVGVEADFNNLETSITVSPILTTSVHKDHPVSKIISDLSLTTQTKSMTRVVQDQGGLLQMFNDDFHTCMFACFLLQEEPKRVHQALKVLSWIEAMQEELLQIKMQKVWILVDLPHGKRAIGTKWVFRNKKDKRGIMVRNKARLVTQGHIQEEGINYEEVFAPVARIEAIRLFLAYATFMGFMAYQIDIKSSFLYGTIEEEVYVCQPLGFEDPDHPDKVYKVVKALYGLHQAPRAWYETLANYLLENGFQRGKIDQTLFIKRQKGDILLVQIYVDDIIFGATNKDLCKSFEKLMKDKFHMSSMEELTFFLGLQVKQKKDGIFISQDKYVAKILSKFRLTEEKSASTPIDTKKPLLKDPDSEDVDVHTYRLIIGSLMYLTSSRPDIMFAAYVTAVSSEVVAVSSNELVNDITRLQALVDRKKVVIIEATIREALHLDDAEGVDCLPNEEIFTKLARMGYEKPSTKLTFYKAFFSSQWKFLIHTILQCISAKRTLWNEFSSSMTSAVICLSTGRKFDFSKKQVGDSSTHTTKYASPALTQKVFANIRRIGKGFFGIETPLFEGMLVEQEIDKEGDAAEHVEEVNTGDATE
nr:hypothetical protein [Tanacetum cinerariifolium]